MKREREELRRGLRSFIQDAGAELADFMNGAVPAAAPERSASGPPAGPGRPAASAPPATPPAPPAAGSPAAAPRPAAGDRLEQPIRPILRLVRDVAPVDPPPPSVEEMTLRLPRKGVCAAYFANKRCWELPDAYCNHALHVCRLRECPVYDLHQEEMERRFAAKFRHLW
ncbi:MAG: hypothetical protein QN141_06270 [Armatimonadota bacterium]|nr:hypothetical protein [Armatimonadota bacterium]MDR7451899.1 hypothetical protein [Armatimonadota bacterium]MDR7466581.1 hypothetical protein [Armatimonadota bacterium]MDR7495097.1 hypothetical protein [Armatimonadota bacterium]MDR7500171.1 hypothetical protein [Armatimonadota bacterium]